MMMVQVVMTMVVMLMVVMMIVLPNGDGGIIHGRDVCAHRVQQHVLTHRQHCRPIDHLRNLRNNPLPAMF